MRREEQMDSEKMSNSFDKNDDDVLLPGFRFHPTDEELVGFYLRRKVEKKPLSIEIIKQIDIYKYDPWDLPKLSTVGDKESYFFCLRGRKYKNSIRPNRVTGSGFWKATGIDRPIYSASEKSTDCIGLKKSLVYYVGSAGKGTKTDWMMHEFRLPTGVKNSNLLNGKNTQEAEIWTICRILKRTVSYRKFVPDWSSSSVKQNPTDANSKTCSYESDDREKYHCFKISTSQHIEKPPPVGSHIEEMNQLISDQYSSIIRTPSTELLSGFPNSNSTGFFKEGTWDELGALVEFAVDPSLVYGVGSTCF